MAEDKTKKDKKTKEISENIYALNLDFDNETDEIKNDAETVNTEKKQNFEMSKNNEKEFEENIYKLEEIDGIDEENIYKLKDVEDIEEEPKAKKKLSKIEEGIKSSKRGKGRPRKTDKVSAVKAKKQKKNASNKLSAIKMHTEDNITEIKLKENEYKIELQREEYNIYTDINETSYIIVREPCLRMVSGGVYIFMERKKDEYSITTNQNFKINYVIDNLERRNNVVNFKLTNLTQVEADEDGLIFEIDEEKIVENNLEDNKTLVISEEEGKVYLPYTKAEVKEDMVQNKGKKISELIEQKYILPLDRYKNSMKARFREGYNLMYKREGKSRRSAFMLGLELMFETNLHPAIISACKNLEELDIYLDCLEDNELEKFSCFKIIYKSLPTLRKKGKNRTQTDFT